MYGGETTTLGRWADTVFENAAGSGGARATPASGLGPQWSVLSAPEALAPGHRGGLGQGR